MNSNDFGYGSGNFKPFGVKIGKVSQFTLYRLPEGVSNPNLLGNRKKDGRRIRASITPWRRRWPCPSADSAESTGRLVVWGLKRRNNVANVTFVWEETRPDPRHRRTTPTNHIWKFHSFRAISRKTQPLNVRTECNVAVRCVPLYNAIMQKHNNKLIRSLTNISIITPYFFSCS